MAKNPTRQNLNSIANERLNDPSFLGDAAIKTSTIVLMFGNGADINGYWTDHLPDVGGQSASATSTGNPIKSQPILATYNAQGMLNSSLITWKDPVLKT